MLEFLYICRINCKIPILMKFIFRCLIGLMLLNFAGTAEVWAQKDNPHLSPVQRARLQKEREEAERRRKAEAERKQRAEAERKRQEEQKRQNELKRKEEELKRKEEELRRKEEELKAKQEAEAKAEAEEKARIEREEAERKRKEEEAKLMATVRYDASSNSIVYGNNSYKMVYVNGGIFTMGATAEQGDDAYDWEKPAHQVTLSGYYMGRTEVPQWLWTAVMGSNPSNWQGDNLPVETVSWTDCQTFISKLNSLTGKSFRLPTEAEWEFAARGGNRSRGYKYSGSDNLGSVAWYRDNSDSRTHNVATKSSNELGLYDMSGNVWEWCSDWYGGYSDYVQTNPKGASSGSFRVLRGGSWDSNAWYCRVSNRNYISPSYRNGRLGLRLAL